MIHGTGSLKIQMDTMDKKRCEFWLTSYFLIVQKKNRHEACFTILLIIFSTSRGFLQAILLELDQLEPLQQLPLF